MARLILSDEAGWNAHLLVRLLADKMPAEPDNQYKRIKMTRLCSTLNSGTYYIRYVRLMPISMGCTEIEIK
jgi:hypothetical protein